MGGSEGDYHLRILIQPTDYADSRGLGRRDRQLSAQSATSADGFGRDLSSILERRRRGDGTTLIPGPRADLRG